MTYLRLEKNRNSSQKNKSSNKKNSPKPQSTQKNWNKFTPEIRQENEKNKT